MEQDPVVAREPEEGAAVVLEQVPAVIAYVRNVAKE
jgi:hypothetical protein